MIVWVIGNGQSRKNFVLDSIQDYTIGCNAVYRDYKCDELVAVDMRMVNEILTNNNHLPVYTRQDWVDHYSDLRVRFLPDLPFNGELKADQPFHWNSGPYSILLAALKNPIEIHLIGFDLWSKNDRVNNVYKDTANYAKSSTSNIDPSLWIYQLEKLFRHYPQIQFIQHQETNWQIPPSWLVIKNLTIVYDIV